MKSAAILLALGQLVLLTCAVMMGVWVLSPRPVEAGLILLGINLTLLNLPALKAQRENSKWPLVIAWLGTVIVWVDLAATKSIWNNFYSWLAWVVGASFMLASARVADARMKSRWRRLTIFWAFFGNVIWLADSYMRNESFLFYAGLLFLLVLLVLCQVWFRIRACWVQIVNTLLCLVVLLPLADFLVRPHYHLDTRPETGLKYHSYSAAKKDPAAFARWWDFYVQQWGVMGGTVFMPAPDKALPFRLRPNSQGFLFQSKISINSRGFRGREIAEPKGGTFRIVALGESTTFGCTLRAEDRPWPEMLEQMIRERLKPSRPVEVINAGVPAYTLTQNLRRLAADILPLQPDLIISYHGFNGFELLRSGMAHSKTKPPPAYRERPIKLLADCEYRLKMLLYKRGQALEVGTRQPIAANPMATDYARAYEQLIAIAQTNRIQLAVANFAMAVNDKSVAEMVEFYRSRYPSVYWQIKANRCHSAIIAELARQYPEILAIDAQKNLDGDPEKFIDLVHFTDDGRRQLAENIFAAIKPALEKNLAIAADD